MLKSRDVPDDPGTPVIDIRTGRELSAVEIKTGLRVYAEHDLGPLCYSDLGDNEVVEVLQRLARGEPPGVDLFAHQLAPEVWERRCAASGRSVRPLGAFDEGRRRKRKAKKRRTRKH